MIYLDKKADGKEFKNELGLLPYVSITKDTLLMMQELLTNEEIGEVMADVVNEIYCDCEYAKMRKTHIQDVVFRQITDNIGRLSTGYFTKVRNLKNNKIGKEGE